MKLRRSRPPSEELDFGTIGHDYAIHIVDGRWDGPLQAKGNVALCGKALNRRLMKIEGRERRVCQDCNERWLS